MKKVSIFIIICLLILLFVACTAKSPTEFIDGINTYKMSINISEDLKSAALSQSITITNNSEDTWEFAVFNIYANAYKENAETSAYFSTPTVHGGVDIMGISSNGIELGYEDLSCTAIKVHLNEPLTKGKTQTIDIESNINAPICNLRFGYNNGVLNLASFYPVLAVYEDGAFRTDAYSKIGDPFYIEAADYEVEIICPEKLIVAASCDKRTEEIAKGLRIIKIEAKSIRDFALSASFNYKEVSGVYNDTTVKYYHTQSKSASTNLDVAINALKTFSQLFGEYPYKYYSVVETSYYYGGMEYSGLVFINSASTDKESIIIHETAHQWFALMVGSDAINNSWLDEALVSFLTDYYYLKNDNKAKFDTLREDNKKATEAYITLQRQTSNVDCDFSLEKSIYEYNSNYEYSMVVYTRGSMVFDLIYEFCGQKRFEAALKDYFENSCYRIATKADLYKAFKDNKADIEPIAEGWINEKTLLGTFM